MSVYRVPVRKYPPFFRIFPALAAGIILQWYTGISEKWWWWLMPVCFGSLILSFTVSLFSLFRYSSFPGITITFLLIAAGALRLHYQDIRHDPRWFGRDSSSLLLVQTKDDPAEKTKTWQTNADVLAVSVNGNWEKRCGALVLYFQKDSLSPPPPAGARLLLFQQPEPVRNSGNPGAFDYKRYLLFQGITHQLFLKDSSYILLPGNHASFIQNQVLHIRHFVLKNLRRYIPVQPEQGLAEALLVGYKNDLDKTLVQSYSNTGVVHIIAISGLHLGLVYGLLSWICIPLKKKKQSRWMIPFIILAGLWIFSLVAGASPSVLRSAFMFSCILLGRTLNRKSSMLNSMALSATILIWLNPFCLWDAGFQLSYAAVLSIVLFMKPVYNLLYFPNKLLDTVWKLAAVSIAAQILTTPVSLYLFHQFPVYFLLTNILAVPLSGLIVLGEIVLLAVSAFTLPAFWTGKILTCLITWMNSWIRHVEVLPGSLIRNIGFSFIKLLLFYLLIITLHSAFRSASRWSWYGSGFLFILLITDTVYRGYQQDQQQTLLIYDIPKQPLIDIYSGGKIYCYTKPGVLTDPRLETFTLHPARLNYGRAGIQPQVQWLQTGLYHAGSYTLFYCEENPDPEMPSIICDWLLLSGYKVREIPPQLHFREMICTAAMPRKQVSQWKKYCDSLHIPFCSIAEQGAFVRPLN